MLHAVNSMKSRNGYNTTEVASMCEDTHKHDVQHPIRDQDSVQFEKAFAYSTIIGTI